MKIFNKFWHNSKRIIILVLLIFTLITVTDRSAFSQSITGINAEISNLRSRINRLESEVRNLRTSNSNPRTSNNNPPRESRTGRVNNPPVVNDRAIGSSDPFYERLATLIIELKEDVRDIESRLVVLEERTK